jgi:hypothetical protein
LSASSTRSKFTQTDIKEDRSRVIVASKLIGATCACGVISSAHTAFIEDIPVAIAFSFRNSISSTYTALIQDVAIAVAFSFQNSSASAHSTLVKDIAVAVAVSFRNSSTSTNTTLIQHVAIAIAESLGSICASTSVNRPWSLANATLVILAHAIVYVITNPILVNILCTGTSTHTQGVKLVSFTITESIILGIRATAVVLYGTRIVIAC